ncbi:MAG: dipeptidase [Chlamydiota bacterium]
MASLSELKKWIEKHSATVRDQYFQFLRFPSISTDPAYSKEMKKCSEWVSDFLVKKAKMKVECIETVGYPVVYAEDLSAGPNAPTLLIYGHYDVQPVDPLELWESDPFDPTEREGRIYARGAVDDKGQIFYAMLAIQCWKELGRKLSINVKFCIEGEEESASVGLAKALPQLKEKLRADFLLVVDSGQLDSETPAVTLGCRGIVALEVTLTGSKGDLHSGMYGGLAYNPNRALAELIAKLWDAEGHVQVKGFYDDVVELSESELSKYAFRFNPRSFSKEYGIEALGGERDRSPKEANCFRPTLEINGMFGGYTGAGMKTVIPAKATAKITCRLVPNQDPHKIAKQVTEFLKKNVVPGMKIQVDFHGGDAAFSGDPDSKLAKAVVKASTEVCGKQCENVVSGGSIPIVADLSRVTGAAAVCMGYGLPTDNIHAPNEHFDLGRLEKGFLTVARILELI